MGREKTGVICKCPACDKPFYRQQHNIRSGTKLTCSVRCAGEMRKGELNSYWGKTHSPEIRARISERLRMNPPKGTGPKKGIFKHTQEAREKMSAALRERWRTRRVEMLSYSLSGENTPYDEIVNQPRHRFIFTDTQKKEWVDVECAYCGSFTDLVLDHIIPIICGGTNIRCNAQTLCQPCNRWKMKHVDRPLYRAILGSKRGIDT